MIYKNIEIHNVCKLIEHEDGSVTWCKMPRFVYDALEFDDGRKTLMRSTGVELRFVINSPTATLKIQSLSAKEFNTSLQLYYGGIQGGWEAHELNSFVSTEPCEIVIKKPANLELLDRVTAETGLDWDPRVVRVIFNRGEYRIIDIEGDVEPPKPSQTPKKTLLTYGSSITHGSNAYAMPGTWSYVLAHNLNTDIINFGMEGQCRIEPEVIEYIASMGEQGKWDVATMELGVNVLEWPDEKIYERVTNAVRQVAGRNPNKPIFVISPFYCNVDFIGGEKAAKWRRIVKEICEKEAFPNVTYINGCDILGDISLISADMVHPNIYGITQIAERLTAIIKPKF